MVRMGSGPSLLSCANQEPEGLLLGPTALAVRSLPDRFSRLLRLAWVGPSSGGGRPRGRGQKPSPPECLHGQTNDIATHTQRQVLPCGQSPWVRGGLALGPRPSCKASSASSSAVSAWPWPCQRARRRPYHSVLALASQPHLSHETTQRQAAGLPPCPPGWHVVLLGQMRDPSPQGPCLPAPFLLPWLRRSRPWRQDSGWAAGLGDTWQVFTDWTFHEEPENPWAKVGP